MIPEPESLFAVADDRFEHLKARVTAAETLAMSHDTVERLINDEGREVLRDLFQAHLDLRGLSEPVEPVTGSDGCTRTHRRCEASRRLTSVLGDVEVCRTRYEGRGLSSLSPVDGDLNLPPEKYSLEVRRVATKSAARMSFDATVEHLAETTGASVPKRQLEQLIRRAATDFVPYYEQSMVSADPTETSDVVVMTFDGKGVVMRNDGLREATRWAAEKAKPKLRSRLTKGEKRNRKRMACVAAVYTVAPYLRTAEQVVGALWRDDDDRAPPRPRPEFKRVWASLARPAVDVMDEAFAEAASRDPERTKHWIVVVDGDPHQIRRIKHVAKRYRAKITLVLDLIHVLEYLWKAAHVFNAEGTAAAEQWVRERLLRVLHGKAGLVAGGISRSATKRGLSAKARKSADECARYLLNHKAYLRYDEALRKGYPISSGVIEGACRHLIRDRLEQTGCRWSLEGAEAVLCIRALLSSGDFDDYWQFHRHQELRRNHLERYADQRLPALARPRPGSHLRVVK
jgi:hypothetical protein